MFKDITSEKKLATEDIIKELSDREAKERAKMRLDCLKIFDGFQSFSFYYELLMRNESDYRRTKERELSSKKIRLQFERFKLEKSLETASQEETKKIDTRLRAIYRDISLTTKRIAFIREATFEELLKDFQDEYQSVRLNEIKAIEETPITTRDEIVYGILNNPNGTQKLQSSMFRIEDLKKKRKTIRTRLTLPKGTYPYLDQEMKNKVAFNNGSADINAEDIETLSSQVNDVQDLYFEALMVLKYFDQENISKLLAVDVSDYKGVKKLLTDYYHVIDEKLYEIYKNEYKKYLKETSKLFPNRKECAVIEARLKKLGRIILRSIKDVLIEIYKEMEEHYGYEKTIVPLTLEGIFLSNGALRSRAKAAYDYSAQIKDALEEAKRRIINRERTIDDELFEVYGNMSTMSGVDIREEITPVKISEYTSIYRKVYNHKVLEEINEEVNAELSKHNVTKVGGKSFEKKPIES